MEIYVINCYVLDNGDSNIINHILYFKVNIRVRELRHN